MKNKKEEAADHFATSLFLTTILTTSVYFIWENADKCGGKNADFIG